MNTTRQDPSHPKVANILNQQFEATAPNQKWVVDVTMFGTQEGPIFLAGVLDLFSRSLVGWALSSVQDTSLVEQALKMALLRRKPPSGLLHHSDRGSQYTSESYREMLEQKGMIVSMSRTGNGYDNAVRHPSGARSNGNVSPVPLFQHVLWLDQPFLSMERSFIIVNVFILLLAISALHPMKKW